MTTLASTEPEVTRPGWVRCLGGWARDFPDGWRGGVARTFGGAFTWTLYLLPAYQSFAAADTHCILLKPEDRLDPGEQTYKTPDDAAEGCERAREEM